MKNKIGVLGSGTWGTALARMLSVCGHEVTLWSAIETEIDELKSTRRHPNLKGMVLPAEIILTKDIKEVCENKNLLLFAVPSVFVRSTTEKAAQYIADNQLIADVAKGIEPKTLFTMSQIINDELSKHGKKAKIVALSGPTHAEEVALDMPTAIISASEDMEAAEKVQDIFMNTCLRVYTNPDILGVEISGALKNILALSAGIAIGLGCGDNAKAALITRGAAEIARLGIKMGAQPITFAGLAGIGDMIVTCTSMHSRNNRCGILIGKGKAPLEAQKEVGMVVEGINALPAAMELVKKYDCELPICESVNAVVNGGESPAKMLNALMSRDKKAEMWY